jgi:fructose-1,6-bisphosphatase II
VDEGRCICGRFAVVTEAAALAAAKGMGSGDGLSSDLAARDAMADYLAMMPIKGRIVAGRTSGAACRGLCVNDEVGSPTGPWFASPAADEDAEGEQTTWDVAVDPLQALTSLARGTDGALTVLAAGPRGSLMPVPEMYMQKLVVPTPAADVIDLDAPVEKNVRAVAAALGKAPTDVAVVVLDRPRHEELIAQIRSTGARVRLIRDGDVSAGLAVASGDAGVDIYIGIGGSTEGILTAAALRCLGGEIQARFWPVSRHQLGLMKAAGIDNVEARLTTKEMARDGVMFVATAVTGGRFLRGVDVRSDGVHTETLVLCSACHAVRKIKTIHRPDNAGPQVTLGAR